MRGVFWNSDGFKDPAKHLFVKESIRDFKLDFFVISETGRDNFASPFLNHLSGGSDFQWFCVHSAFWYIRGYFGWHKCTNTFYLGCSHR
jgi:hypothetical protein